MDLKTKKLVIDHFQKLVQPERLEKIHRVLQHRTRYITVLLEDIYDSQNASAVLRTAESLGIQDIYVAENRNPFKIKKTVTQGAFKWLDIHRFNKKGSNNTLAAVTELKNRGYKIYATSPHAQLLSPDQIDSKQKTAFIFGSEHLGISQTAMETADSVFKIPMYGFSESYNISVSAALTLFTVAEKMRVNNPHYYLSSQEQQQLLYHWLKKTVRRSDEIEANLIKKVRYNT